MPGPKEAKVAAPAAPSTASSKDAKQSAAAAVPRAKKARNAIPQLDAHLDAVAMGGGVLTARAPLYSQDAKYFFCACSRYIKVFSVATGECVRTLSGHTDEVTHLTHNPANPLQLVSCSTDGTVRVWDYADGVQLRHHDLQIPLHYVALHPALAPNTALVVSTVTNLKKGTLKRASRVYIYRLKPGKGTKKTTLFKGGECAAAALSPDGLRFAMVAKRKLYMCDIKAGTVEKFGHTHKLHAVAFHPKVPCVATGDAVGKITLWCVDDVMYCIGGERPVVTSSKHWHAHAVSSIAFSGDGAYLLSGGHESVLVVWQLASDSRQFLPRLGGPIRHIVISADEERFLLAHGDNAIRIVASTTLEIEHVIKGFRRAEGVSERLPPTGLVVQPHSALVVTNGLPGTLQFYDPRGDRHVTEAEIIPRNYVSRKNPAQTQYAHVERAAFSADGAWMATIERREAGILSEESRLKFWCASPDSSATSGPYTLTTCCDAPHSKRVEALAFHPTAPIAVTCGLDRRFKLWEKAADASSSWYCRSVGFYQGLPAHAAVFSEDGSLLAVAFGSTVTLWDPLSNVLQGTLSYPPSGDAVRFVGFAAGSPFLVAATESTVYVWNILTCSVWWSYKMAATSIAMDPSSPRFVAFVQDGKTDYRAVVFETATPVPLSVLSLKGHAVWSAAFVPSKGPGASLVCFLNDRFELGTFDAAAVSLRADSAAPSGAVQAQEGTQRSSVDADDDDARAAFSQVFGGAAKGAKARAESASRAEDTGVVGDGRVASVIFNAPSHVIPPASQLFAPFMDLLLVKARPQEPAADHESDGAAEPSGSSAMEVDLPATAAPLPPAEFDDDTAIDLSVYDDFVDFFKAQLSVGPRAAGTPAHGRKGQSSGTPDGRPSVRFAADAEATPAGGKKDSAPKTPATGGKKRKAEHVEENGDVGGDAPEVVENGEVAAQRSARKKTKGEAAAHATPKKGTEMEIDATPAPAVNGRTPKSARKRTSGDRDNEDAGAVATAAQTPRSTRKAPQEAATPAPAPTPKGSASKSKSPASDPSPELIKSLRNRTVKTPKRAAK